MPDVHRFRTPRKSLSLALAGLGLFMILVNVGVLLAGKTTETSAIRAGATLALLGGMYFFLRGQEERQRKRDSKAWKE